MKAFLKSKITLGIFGFIALLCIALAWLFSPLGNAYIANLILEKLESKTQAQWEVRDFKLSLSQFSLDFSTKDKKLELFANGTYSLFAQNLQGDFLLNSQGFSLKNLKAPKFLSNKTLTFADNTWIEGKFSGKFSHYFIQAQSNLLQARSDLGAYFSYFEPLDFKLSIKDASLALALIMLEENPYCDGVASIDLHLQQSPNGFDGNILINVDGGDLDPIIFAQVFGLEITPTHFAAQLQGEIHQNALEYNFNLYSNVGDILLNGTSNIHSLATNANFDIKLQSLSPFSPFFKIPLNGYFATKGSAKGDIKNMLILGGMTLENSPLDFRLNLKNLKPHTLQISSQNLQAQSLFKLFNQPNFLNGILNLEVDLRDFAKGVSGLIQIQSQNLLVNSPLLETKTYIGFPHSAFKLNSKMELAQGKGILEYLLESSLAKFQSQNGTITLNPFTLNLPQEIKIHKLQNLSLRNKSFINGILQAKGITTQNGIDLSGEIIQNTKHTPTSLTLSKKGLNFHLSNLTSGQIYTFFPKIPRHFEGNTNLNFMHNFTKNSQHINLDITQLRFRNTALLKALNTASCKSLSKTQFNGHFYNQFQKDSLQSTILLQDKNAKDSKALQIQSSKVITNLNTQNLSGNLSFKCGLTTKESRLKGTIYQPKLY